MNNDKLIDEPEKPGFLRSMRTNAVAWFLAKTAGMVLALELLYVFVLNPARIIDLPMIQHPVLASSLLLLLFGYRAIDHVFEDMRTMGIDGTNGVWIGDSCNGITLFAVFAIIIIALPGPVKTKSWYIPMGMLIIHVSNIIRITVLSIIVFYKPDILEFNHTYTFQLIEYTIMFVLWMRWVNKYSGLSLKRV